MDRDTEKIIQEEGPMKTPIFKRKKIIIALIAFVVVLGAVIFSITFGKHGILQIIFAVCSI